MTGEIRHFQVDVSGGVGHDLPREAPEEFARAVIDVDHF
jgi:pimeloyl-ACP methyl ester carboxylesterase